MTPEQFVYWLQGYVEISGGKQPYMEEWQIIQDHLKLVMKKETPIRFDIKPSPNVPVDLNRWYYATPPVITC